MIRYPVLALLGVAVSATVVTTAYAGGAGTAYELEHARANARAGGPISDYDAELLERWGNSTGGPDWRKQYRAQQGYRDETVRNYRQKKKAGDDRD